MKKINKKRSFLKYLVVVYAYHTIRYRIVVYMLWVCIFIFFKE
ncbi:hypothetical protein CKO_02468 [Citrobacter koseri ATCC BAA-895]|uniref:Uncharacterized protein n=1 Tax=Citrobacter koseri (strain ATCC BAA-895 / CDC 4225-83 / SGSC4696) TaxID=290338 RepID=A8AJC2_CITK8|nr:hypothetical protein CKO_02468 [Citrobacter koseri ATCC BAA-895]